MRTTVETLWDGNTAVVTWTGAPHGSAVWEAEIVDPALNAEELMIKEEEARERLYSLTA